MAADKKKAKKEPGTGSSPASRSMREAAEKKLAEIPEIPPELNRQTTEELIHELQVHQIELETQAEELRRVQLDLGESRDQYLDLYDFAPLGYMTLTESALISRINLTMAGLLGVERKNLVGSRFRPYIVPEDLHIWDDFFTSLVRADTKLTTTLMLRRNGTSFFPARLEGTRSVSGDGTPSLRVAVSDISDIRLEERGRRESESLLKTVIELLPVGILILDEKEEVISINPESERIWSGARSMGTWKFSECTCRKLESGDLIHANDWAGVRAIRKGETTIEEQIEIVCPGGAHKIALNSAMPLRRSDGSIRGSVVVTQDITEGKIAEERIRWLASFPEQHPNPVIEIDAEGIVTFSNTATRKILKGLGLPNDPSVFIPEDLEEILQLLREGSEPQIYREITLGNERFAENIALENVLHVARIYAWNITDIKRAEDALKESEKRYHDIFELSNAVMLIVNPENGRIVDANAGAIRYYGYSREEFSRLVITDINIADPAIVKKNMSHAIKNHGFVFTFRHRKKNGEIRTVEVYSAPVTLGGQTLLHSIIQDVTDRNLAEDALKESEEFNRNLVENLPDYIVVCGPDNTILYVNPAAEHALELDGSVIRGSSCLAYIPEEYHEQVIAKIATLNSGKEFPGHEIAILTGEGSRISVLVKGTPIKYHGHPAILLLLTDITGRKMLEDDLKKEAEKMALLSTASQTANKKLNLLTSITRHDINNQLMVLKGYLELLRMETPDTVNVEYFTHITQAVTRISGMIQFTKTYEEIGVHAPVCRDIRELVETAMPGLPGGVILENAIPPGREMMADPLITKVFFNLMDNAIRYGEKITTIRYSGREQDGDYLITCEDDGVGIPADMKEKIFERGFGKNTGLGLSISREIAAITGITIHETGEPGKGARFEIRVPHGMWHIAPTGKKE